MKISKEVKPGHLVKLHGGKWVRVKKFPPKQMIGVWNGKEVITKGMATILQPQLP